MPGPGTYSPEKNENQTRHKSPIATYTKAQSRPKTFANNFDSTLAPGQYNAGKPFGTNAKGFTIGTKKEQRAEISPGPGSYNANTNAVKPKATGGIIPKNPKSRQGLDLKVDKDLQPASYKYQVSPLRGSPSKSTNLSSKTGHTKNLSQTLAPGAFSNPKVSFSSNALQSPQKARPQTALNKNQTPNPHTPST